MRIAEETFPVEDQANANYISIINFCIPDKLLHHEDRGHNVLFLDSKTTDLLLERILVSGLPESFDLIRRACQIIADGTFSTYPSPFAQNYQLHVIVDGFILNVLQCLLPGKSKAHYLRLLDMLLRKCPELARLLFIIDFELAMIVAIQEKFPEAFIGVPITVYAKLPVSRNSRRLYSQLSPLSAARQKQSILFAITRYASSQMSRTRTAHVYHRLRVGYDRRN